MPGVLNTPCPAQPILPFLTQHNTVYFLGERERQSYIVSEEKKEMGPGERLKADGREEKREVARRGLETPVSCATD